MASFPGAVKSFTPKADGRTIFASHVNDLQDEVVAIEAGYLNGTAILHSSAARLATLTVDGGSTFQAFQSSNSTLATLRVTGGSTLDTLQSSNSSMVNLDVSAHSSQSTAIVHGSLYVTSASTTTGFRIYAA